MIIRKIATPNTIIEQNEWNKQIFKKENSNYQIINFSFYDSTNAAQINNTINGISKFRAIQS